MLRYSVLLLLFLGFMSPLQAQENEDPTPSEAPVGKVKGVPGNLAAIFNRFLHQLHQGR